MSNILSILGYNSQKRLRIRGIEPEWDTPLVACEKEKKEIMETFDKIMKCDAAYREMSHYNFLRMRVKLSPENNEKRKKLMNMTRRQTWDTYNECARKFSEKRGIDLVECLFERVVDISLGNITDEHHSAKYAVLLLNTIFDERRDLAANPGFRPRLATLRDINEASILVMELLTDGAITIEVADRFHRLLSSRVSLIGNTVLSDNLDKIKDFMEKFSQGEITIEDKPSEPLHITHKNQTRKKREK